MKYTPERRKHCAPAAVPHRHTESAMALVRQSQNFPPLQTPFPAAQDCQNLISWRWSCTYRPSLVKIDARNFQLS